MHRQQFDGVCHVAHTLRDRPDQLYFPVME
jgi:hypothetical protein